MLYRQVAALAGRRPDLDDIVQNAAERVLRSLPRFEGRASLSTWTYGIAYRTLIDHDRWHRRWARRWATTPVDPASPADTGLAFEQMQRALRLRAALDQLSPKKRAVVVLYEFEGLELKDIALVVGANERTVRSRLRDARLKLGELLRRDPLFERDGHER
jgi:RNA polymerase sigma-70 factor (ECF subfamily)